MDPHDYLIAVEDWLTTLHQVLDAEILHFPLSAPPRVEDYK